MVLLQNETDLDCVYMPWLFESVKTTFQKFNAWMLKNKKTKKNKTPAIKQEICNNARTKLEVRTIAQPFLVFCTLMSIWHSHVQLAK